MSSTRFPLVTLLPSDLLDRLQDPPPHGQAVHVAGYEEGINPLSGHQVNQSCLYNFYLFFRHS